ncbi:MAG: dihydroorotase [Eubacteriales bacterium]|nr:dihydroorotase [Eubacteriales bacterium]
MILIKNGYLINPKARTEGRRDILIANGRIVQIRTALTERYCEAYAADPSHHVADPALRVIDASHLIVAPGLVDTHSHFRDPGYPLKEDIVSGANSAMRGGYTTIIMMANTKPPIDNVDSLRDVLERGDQTPIHIYSAANATIGMGGRELTDFHALKEAGAACFTDDGKPILDPVVFLAALKAAKKERRPLSLHEENPAYIKQNGVNAGGYAARFLHLEGSSREAEISMVQRDVDLAVKFMAPLCIQHISTAEAVDIVRQGRKRNRKIHAEATPHHFALTEEAVLRCGTMAKMNPPLRTEEDRLAIIDGLCDGTIDIIATDHAPHTAEEKALPFAEAPSGIIGLETALSLGIRELVNKGYLSMTQLIECLSCNPAAYYCLPAGRVETGGPADLVLFDEHEVWKVEPPFASRSSNTPFIGETMPGVVHYTICGGKVVYEK